jgi:hypothetical protein
VMLDSSRNSAKSAWTIESCSTIVAIVNSPFSV